MHQISRCDEDASRGLGAGEKVSSTRTYIGSPQWSSQPDQGVRQSPNSASIGNQDGILNNGTIEGVYISFLMIINAIVTRSSS